MVFRSAFVFANDGYVMLCDALRKEKQSKVIIPNGSKYLRNPGGKIIQSRNISLNDDLNHLQKNIQEKVKINKKSSQTTSEHQTTWGMLHPKSPKPHCNQPVTSHHAALPPKSPSYCHPTGAAGSFSPENMTHQRVT